MAVDLTDKFIREHEGNPTITTFAELLDFLSDGILPGSPEELQSGDKVIVERGGVLVSIDPFETEGGVTGSIVISVDEVEEGQAPAVAIGTLSVQNSAESWTFLTENNAGDRIANVGAQVVTGERLISFDATPILTPRFVADNGAGVRLYEDIEITVLDVGYSAEALAFFGWAPDSLSIVEKNRYDKLIVALLAAGVWEKGEILYVLKALTEDNAVTNLIQNTFHGVIEGTSSDFVSDYGLKNAASSRIDTNYNPVTAPTPKFIRDSAAFIVFTNKPGGNAALLGNAAGAVGNRLYPRLSVDDKMYVNVNASSDDTTGLTVSTAAGSSGGSRINSSEYKYYRDGLPVRTRANVSAAVPQDNIIIGSLSEAATGYVGDIDLVWIGGGLTDAEFLALHTACQEYLSDALADDGATYPGYGATSWPSAAYDAETEKTWVVWEAWKVPIGQVTEKRVSRVRVYDHTIQEWSDAYDVGVSLLVDDDHGVPIIFRDDAGYWHCMFGAHSTQVLHSVTASPGDPSVWIARPPLEGDPINLTYPKPIMIGATCYVFLRGGGETSDNSRYLSYFTTTFTDGIEDQEWAGPFEIGDFGELTRFYAGTFNVKPGTSEIHFPFTLSPDSQPSTPRNTYYGIYDAADGSFSNIDGSFVIAAGNLPANPTQLDDNFMIYESAVGFGGDVPSACFDAADDIHIIFNNGEFAGSDFDIVHIAYVSSVLSSPVVVGTTHTPYSQFCITPAADGGVDAYFTRRNDPAFSFSGGDLYTAHRSAAGSWGAEELLRPVVDNAYSATSPVANAHPSFRMVFFEVLQESADNAAGIGTLKGHGWGDTGYLRAFPG